MSSASSLFLSELASILLSYGFNSIGRSGRFRPISILLGMGLLRHAYWLVSLLPFAQEKTVRAL